MRDAIYSFPMPTNEPVLTYLKGSPERVALEKELERQKSIELDIPLIIGGKEIRTENTFKVTMPHDHGHVIAECSLAGEKELKDQTDPPDFTNQVDFFGFFPEISQKDGRGGRNSRGIRV